MLGYDRRLLWCCSKLPEYAKAVAVYISHISRINLQHLVMLTLSSDHVVKHVPCKNDRLERLDKCA